jgi:hypothetical protein
MKMKKKTLFLILATLLILILVFVLIFLINTRESQKDNAVQDTQIDVDVNEGAGENMEVPDEEKLQEMLESRYPRIDGEIVNEELITSDLPSNFPIPGGEIQMFRDRDGRTHLRMSTVSIAKEVYEWYRQNLKNTEWSIEDSTMDNNRGVLTINNEKMESEIRITGMGDIQTDIIIDIFPL